MSQAEYCLANCSHHLKLGDKVISVITKQYAHIIPITAINLQYDF